MNNLKQLLTKHSDPSRATVSQRFFKTGIGEYGEGDLFLGLDVPTCRSIAKQFVHLNLDEIKVHLHSPFNEERLIACLILVEKYKKAHDRKDIVDFYLAHLKGVNNWNLVDSSADKLLGDYLLDSKDLSLLEKLAKSNNLWERRVAMVATFAFIKAKQYGPTQHIALLLMRDTHDLIHKAMGWMLREMGKRDERVLKDFLKKYYSLMPRTALRYAIERFPPAVRKSYLEGTV